MKRLWPLQRCPWLRKSPPRWENGAVSGNSYLWYCVINFFFFFLPPECMCKSILQACVMSYLGLIQSFLLISVLILVFSVVSHSSYLWSLLSHLTLYRSVRRRALARCRHWCGIWWSGVLNCSLAHCLEMSLRNSNRKSHRKSTMETSTILFSCSPFSQSV